MVKKATFIRPVIRGLLIPINGKLRILKLGIHVNPVDDSDLQGCPEVSSKKYLSISSKQEQEDNIEKSIHSQKQSAHSAVDVTAQMVPC